MALLLLGVHEAKGMAAASAFAHSDRTPLVSKGQVIDTIAFTPSLDAVKRMWYFIADTVNLEDFVRTDAFPSKCHPTGVCAREKVPMGWRERLACVCVLVIVFDECVNAGVWAVLTVLCTVFEHVMRVVDEFEFYQDQRPLPRREIKEVVALLKSVVARSCGCVALCCVLLR